MQKHSLFNHIIKYDNKYIVYNFFTSSMVEFDQEFYEKFENNNLSSHEIGTLSELGIIDNDGKQMEYIYDSYIEAKNDKSTMNITIELTNACNLRCKYCYQEHKSKKICKKNSESLIRFIKDNVDKGLKSLHIHWFGGEPTLNLEQAQFIDKEIKKITSIKELNYNSSMTTNGFKLKEKYDQFLFDMNISNYQITLDGLKDTHDFSRPHYNGRGTFDEIVNSIKYLIEKDEKITLRYNVNKINKNLDQFILFLKESNIGKNVVLHIQPTTNFELSEKIDDFYFKSNKEYSDVLKTIYYTLLKNGYQIPKYLSRGTNCPFDCSNNFMITSSLDILRCSSCDKTEKSLLGRILDGKMYYDKMNYKEKINTISFKNEKCIKCKVLPICKGGCYLKKSLNMDECIPEVYFLDDYVKMLYLEEMNVQNKQRKINK